MSGCGIDVETGASCSPEGRGFVIVFLHVRCLALKIKRCGDILVIKCIPQVGDNLFTVSFGWVFALQYALIVRHSPLFYVGRIGEGIQ